MDPLLPYTGDMRTLSLLRNLSEVLSVVLGLGISYIAYRGYRRNGSRPMLFVSAGFVLIVGLPAVLFLLLYVALSLPAPVANSAAQVCEFCGLVSILYGLRMPGRG